MDITRYVAHLVMANTAIAKAEHDFRTEAAGWDGLFGEDFAEPVETFLHGKCIDYLRTTAKENLSRLRKRIDGIYDNPGGNDLIFVICVLHKRFTECGLHSPKTLAVSQNRKEPYLMPYEPNAVLGNHDAFAKAMPTQHEQVAYINRLMEAISNYVTDILRFTWEQYIQ